MNTPSTNLRVTALLSRSAQQFPGNICTIDAATGRERTYKDTLDRVSRLAGGLQAHGLSEEGRVALVMLNSDKYYECFFGCSWSGGIVVPMNIRLAPPEMIEQFNDCGVEFVVVDDAFVGLAEKFRNSVPTLKGVIYAGEKPCPDAFIGYETMISQSSPCNDSLRGGDEVFGLFYTGGTTGKPKGVMLTHGNIFVNAIGHVAMLAYTPESRYLHSAPMFHLADGASTFGITAVAGSHVFIPKFVPKDMLSAIQEFKVTKAMMVPSMISMMLQVENQESYDCSSLENIIYGASPMPDALLGPAMGKFPKASFTQGYGMSETSPAITMLPANCHSVGHPKLRSVGRPVPWVEVRIVDTNNNEVARNTVGEIVCRGPNVMKGYWNMPEKTSETIDSQGYMHTEDAGYMDDDGFVFIVDRIKDMIITGGENVYASEVENAIMKMPGISMCAVIGTPDQKFGELVTAVLVQGADKSYSEDDVTTHCRNLIAGYKVPRKVHFRESLPISGAGKILKAKIRDEFKTDALGRLKL